jgi:hypothetical protein
MLAQDMAIILQNIDNDGCIMAAKIALRNERFDWDDPEENLPEDAYYKPIGDAIRDYVNEKSGNLADKNTLTGFIFGAALNGIDWRDIGERFYEDAAESED